MGMAPRMFASSRWHIYDTWTLMLPLIIRQGLIISHGQLNCPNCRKSKSRCMLLVLLLLLLQLLLFLFVLLLFALRLLLLLLLLCNTSLPRG